MTKKKTKLKAFWIWSDLDESLCTTIAGTYEKACKSRDYEASRWKMPNESITDALNRYSIIEIDISYLPPQP